MRLQRIRQYLAGLDRIRIRRDSNSEHLLTDQRCVECLDAVAAAKGTTLVGTVSQAASGKRLPDQTLIGAAIVKLIGQKYGIPRVDKTRRTGLQFQAVDYQLQRNIISAAAVMKIGVPTIRIDQGPSHFPDHGGPCRAYAMRHTRHLDPIISTGIDQNHVGAVGKVANTYPARLLSNGISTHAPRVGRHVARFNGHHDREIITPTLACLFGIFQTKDIVRPARQTN